MPSIPFLYNDFSHGLDTLHAPYLLDQTDIFARDVSNVQATTAGAILKRTGFTTFATPAQPITSLFALESVNPVVLIATGGVNMYSISTAGAITNIGPGLASGLNWSFVSAPSVAGQGPLYGVNGSDTPKHWTGAGNIGTWTATDAGGSVPNGKYVAYWKNQVFMAGVAANPSRVYWSGIADPTAWNPVNPNGSGFIDLDPSDGQSITSIAVVGPYLMVAKPRKLWVLVDAGTATVRQVSNNVGVAAHRSVAVASEGAYFLAEDRGVFLFNGTKLTPISDIIQPTIDGLQGPRSQAVAAYFNAHYYLSVPLNSATNDTILDFDAKLNSWWKHTQGSNQFAVWHPTVGTAGLYSAKATSAIIDNCFVPGVYQDNGANFTWKWLGPWQSPTFYRRRRFPTPYFRKNLRQMRCEGFGTVDFSLATDFSGEHLWQSDVFNHAVTGGTFGGSGTFGGAGTFGPPTVQRARFFSMGRADAFSLVFSATSNSQDAVFEYTLMLADRKDLVVS